MRQRVVLWLESIPSWGIVLAIAVSFTLRASYAFFISDPMSGPDAPTYRDSAQFIAANGYFSPGIPGIPYWPPGYSLLLGPVALLGGADWMKVAQLLQVVLVTAASVLSWSVIDRWAGRAAANLALLILLFLPSLTGSAPLLMYEVPLGFFVTLGIWAASRVIQPLGIERRLYVWALVAGIGLGVAIAMSPKAVLILVGVIVLFAYKRKFLELILVAFVSLVPVVPVVVRNRLIEGHFGITWELGATMNQRSGNFQAVCSGSGSMFESDPQIVDCRLRSYLSEPITFITSGITETLYFLWPFTGPQSSGSTWYHGFNVRRILPENELSNQVVTVLDRWQAPVSIVVVLVFFVAGIVAARRLSWPITVLLLLPTITFWFVTFGVRGDGRFRIPVLFTAVAFVAVALVSALNRQRDFAWTVSTPLSNGNEEGVRASSRID